MGGGDGVFGSGGLRGGGSIRSLGGLCGGRAWERLCVGGLDGVGVVSG